VAHACNPSYSGEGSWFKLSTGQIVCEILSQKKKKKKVEWLKQQTQA
jgi:hypothetical protein